MENLQPLNPPDFTDRIPKVGEEDYITAELENRVKEALLTNDAYLKEKLEELSKKLGIDLNNLITKDSELKELLDSINQNLTTHAQDSNTHISPEEKQNWNQAEANQNAFSSVNAGGTVIQSNGKTAQFALLAGTDNVTVSGDNAKKQVKISVSGGNADTLGGRNASDFIANKKRSLSITDLNNPNYPEPYMASLNDGTGIGLPAGWWHILYFRHQDNNGFGTQLALPLDRNEMPRYRWSSNTTWQGWKIFITSDNIGTQGVNAAAKLCHGGSLLGRQMTFTWLGQTGQPYWVWGGNEAEKMYVYNPSNFNVKRASYLQTQNKEGGWHGDDWVLCCKHDFYGDGLFGLVCGDGSIKVRVDHATYAHTAPWSGISGKPSTYPPAGHSHSPNDLSSTVPISKGGTGATTADAALTNLGAAKRTNTVLYNSVSMGRKTGTTIGEGSTTLGIENEASGKASHAEGWSTTSSAPSSHSEGFHTQVTMDNAHAEGAHTIANGNSAHAEGNTTIASGYAAHAEGEHTTASGNASHASGGYTIAKGQNQTVVGRHNKPDTQDNQVANLFEVGCGYDSNNSANAFRVTYSGDAYIKTAYHTGGADYAEFFEWLDSNPNAEDRVGHFVTLHQDKIQIAKKGDYILGIVSGTPSVVGNSPEDWAKRWQKDAFGRLLKEKSKFLNLEEPGNKTESIELEHPIAVKEYNKNYPYIERKDRPEWSAIGMLGVLRVYDDGTCQVNGFCSVTGNGIATAAENEYTILDGKIQKSYRVTRRIQDNIIEVIFR